MTAEQFANKIAEFIIHNSIDTNKHSMEEIVAGYFAAQMAAIEEAGKQAMEAFK